MTGSFQGRVRPSPQESTIDLVAVLFLGFFTTAVVIAWLNQWTMAGGWSRQKTFPVAVLVSCAIAWFHLESSRYKRLAMVAIGVAALIVVLVLSSLWLDFSWDGLAYHHRAVVELIRGANYLAEPEPSKHLWIDNYARATWYYGASLVQWSGRPELGASYTFVLATVAGCYGYRFCRWAGRGWRAACVLAVLIALNPVTLYQLYSYYNDAALGAISTVLFLSAVIMLNGGTFLDRNVFLLSAILVVNIKASGIIPAASALCYVLIGYWMVEHRCVLALRRWVRSLLIVVVLGYGVLGYSPYMQHVLHGRHIFYPIAGDHPTDIITNVSPPGFTEHGRFRNLFLSLFSFGANVISPENNASPQLKIPGHVDSDELKVFTTTDPRIGGFGPLFSLALVMCVVAAMAVRLEWTVAGPLLFIVVLSVALNPYSWWARYTPTLWLLPLIPLMAIRVVRWPGLRVVPAALVITLIANVVLIFSVWYPYNRDLNAKVWGVARSVRGNVLNIHLPYSYFFADLELERLGLHYRYVSDAYYQDHKGRFAPLYHGWMGIDYELPGSEQRDHE